MTLFYERASGQYHAVAGQRAPHTVGSSRRLQFSSSSEPSSDEDLDPQYPDTALRMLEASSIISGINNEMNGANGNTSAFTSEERLRQQQLVRGGVIGKRVASRSAISSLQSVSITDLPANERSCIICYNDFGVENPEGINEAPLRLPRCKHVFGDHCIKKWFEESDSCPYCRDKLPSEPQFRRHHHAIASFVQQHGMLPRQTRVEAGSSRLATVGPNAGPGSLLDFYDSAGYRRENIPARDPESRRRRPRHGSLRGSPPSPVSFCPL